MNGIQYSDKTFTVISDVFNGMKFENITKSPTVLYKLFTQFKHIEIVVTCGVYFISFRGIYIADIKDRILTITPNIFIHTEKNVFKTINKLLSTFIGNDTFLKSINYKWMLCKTNND